MASLKALKSLSTICIAGIRVPLLESQCFKALTEQTTLTFGGLMTLLMKDGIPRLGPAAHSPLIVAIDGIPQLQAAAGSERSYLQV